MTKVIILYAPNDAGMKRFVEKLQKTFIKKEFSVAVKRAREADISDIAAVNALIIGSKGNSAVSIDQEFQDIVRTFSGVNFSGRSAGIFLEMGTSTFLDFSHALRDTGISVFDDPLVYQEKKTDDNELRIWAEKFSKFVKDHTYAK